MRTPIVHIVLLTAVLCISHHARGEKSTLTPSEAWEAGLISDEEAFDMFDLWAECGPIAIYAAVQDGETIGLTQGRIETALRSRLRGARMYNSDVAGAAGILNVRVLVADKPDAVFTFRVWFEKKLTDNITGISVWNPTGWSRWVFGANYSADDVLTSLAPYIDAFIDDYLRVNEPAC